MRNKSQERNRSPEAAEHITTQKKEWLPGCSRSLSSVLLWLLHPASLTHPASLIHPASLQPVHTPCAHNSLGFTEMQNREKTRTDMHLWGAATGPETAPALDLTLSWHCDRHSCGIATIRRWHPPLQQVLKYPRAVTGTLTFMDCGSLEDPRLWRLQFIWIFSLSLFLSSPGVPFSHHKPLGARKLQSKTAQSQNQKKYPANSTYKAEYYPRSPHSPDVLGQALRTGKNT